MVAALGVSAQSDCTFGRYVSEVFSSYDRTNNITYGSNINLQNQTQSLEMDIWEPSGDTEPLRPILVMEHGGSFISGDKGAVDITTLAEPLAKRGFVIASVEYRLGMAGLPFPGPDSIDASTAVWRAVADFKAAVRFLYKSAQNGNPYRIDTNRLYIGGVSAGAVSAVHYAFLDDINEMPSYIDTTLAGTGGGIEGNSGNPGYSSKAHGVVNVCGMIADTAWIKADDEPIVSLHGDLDDVVPYGTDMITVGGFYPIFVVDGSATITQKLNQLGVDNCFHTYPGGGHTPHINGGADLETTVNFIANFLHHLTCGTPTVCSTLADVEEAVSATELTLVPNPMAGSDFTIQLGEGAPTEWDFQVMDVTGRLLQQGHASGVDHQRVHTSNLASGIYMVKVSSEGWSTQARLLVP
ncbi:MAG: T9SS type A sorting domain-containing protein [Bacteroidia bacterium]